MEIPTALASSSAVAAIRAAQQARHDRIALASIIEAISDHYGLDFETVAGTLETFPENILEFAKTPEGVTALGIAVINDLMGAPVDMPCLLVAIH